MSFSPAQDHSLPQSIPATPLSSGPPELTVDGEHTPFQLEQTANFSHIKSKAGKVPTIKQGIAAIQFGPENLLSPLGRHAREHSSINSEHERDKTSNPNSLPSGHSSRLGFRKRLSGLFHRKPKLRDVAVAAPAATLAPNGHVLRVHAALPEAKVTPVDLDPCPSTQSDSADSPAMATDQVETLHVSNSAVGEWLQPNPSALGSLRLDIFPENVAAPVLVTELPKPHTRIEKTSQLVYCCSLLSKGQSSSSPNAGSDGSQSTPLDESQREWVQASESFEKNHVRWLIDQLVKSFAEDQLKGSTADAEIVLVGPILGRETYRSLLSCFISKFEQTTPLDLNILQGLVQLVEDASSGYLVDNDLVRIATVLYKELETTHNGTSDHPLFLTWALSRVLDVMVAGKVKDLDRDRDHQPMLQLLDDLKGSDNAYLHYQAAYAYQALQYAPDDETPLQVVWRYAQVAAAAASTVSSVFKLDPAGFLEGIESLQKIGEGVIEVGKAGIEGVKTLHEGAGKVVKASESRFDFVKKRSWYLALQGTALFIRQGRLSDFNQVVCQAPCRHNANFQWGICRQLGEIAVDPLWDVRIRQQAVEFLGELYRSNTDWKPHANVKRWILATLSEVSRLSEPSLEDRAVALLEDLKKDGNSEFPDSEFPDSYPLSTRLPLPATFSLLAQVQEIPKVEYALHTLKMHRLDEYKQSVYIAPMAKPSLQASDDTLFPLVDKVKGFLEGEAQVMLILGDSGAGKSNFNRHLEHRLWRNYTTGGHIPLFIHLPALERPEKELVAEQLRIFDFSDEQIRELKHHRQFLLICDGYDESQLTANLHTSNLLNRSGQWDSKLLITCRTQYLGPDYRDRFVPKAFDQYNRSTNDLFIEAVIAPFSRSQIEDYVERYIPLEPRTWVKKDYMDKLTTIPNLMDLAKNPFLLTLALETLPIVVQDKADISRLRISRVQLYDTFVEHWLGVNKRRLLDHKLNDVNREALEVLLADGFERNGILYQEELAAAIFQEQDGKPVIDYSHLRDRQTWKAQFLGVDRERVLLRDSSLLCRTGNQFRFIHRSVLEYFYSCTICGPAHNNDKFAPQDDVDSTITAPSIGDHPLSKRNLVAEPSILQFLAERVQPIPYFKQQLLDLIDLSKSEAQASQAAANAITILVKAGIRFHGADLRGIRILGADLSGGQFDSAQLQGANLTGVDLNKTWIRRANLSNAQMEETRFRELPHLKAPSEVHSCAFSPDGKTLAAGLSNGDISVYDTTTWTTIQSYQGHRHAVKGVAYSPTGHRLVSGGWDKTVRLWNCETGLSDITLKPTTSIVTTVSFSPSGNQFASAGIDNAVRIWDAQTGTIVFVLSGHTEGVTQISFSPGERNIATAGFDKTIRIYDIYTGLSGLVIENGSDHACCVAYSPDLRRLVSGNYEGEIQLWETTTGKPVSRWTGHGCMVQGVSFSPNGQWIASCSSDKTIKLWSAHDGLLASIYTSHSSRVYEVVFSPDGSQLASCSSDKTVRLWEVHSTGTGPDLQQDQSISVKSVAYSPDGRVLISGCKFGIIRQYDADAGETGLAFSCRSSQNDIVSFSPDGLLIASASWVQDASIWNTETGIVECVLRGRRGRIDIVALSPNNHWIATVGHDNTICLWDARSGTPGLVLAGHKLPLVSVAFSPNGLQIVSKSYDGEVRIWEISTGDSRTLVDGDGPHDGIAHVAFAPDGLRIAFSSERKKCIELWDEQKGQLCHTLQHNVRIMKFVFSSNGLWIVAACGWEAWLWSFAASGAAVGGGEWRRVVVVRGFNQIVTSITWRPQSLEFATGCGDGSVRVWKVLDESSETSVQLVWSSGYPILVASEANITGTTGLSRINQLLLEQRGAIDGSLPSDEESRNK